jgi:hypothetical protein
VSIIRIEIDMPDQYAGRLADESDRDYIFRMVDDSNLWDDATVTTVSGPVTGHAYQAAPPHWDWGDHCTWFDTTPPVPPHPVMCDQPERCHALTAAAERNEPQ